MVRSGTFLLGLAGAAAVLLWVGTRPGVEHADARPAVAPVALGPEEGATAPADSDVALATLVPAGATPAPGATRAQRDGQPEVPPASALEVRVTDAVTGQPVAAFFATVLPHGVHAQGRAGVARFEGLPAGPATVAVEGPEHSRTLAPLDLPEAGPIELRLAQLPGLRGVVRFADARPAPDVVLRLEAAPGTVGPAPEAGTATHAKTDAEGRYRFAPLPPGSYVVAGEHLGRALPPLGPLEVGSTLTEAPELRLEAGARLELVVEDAGGAPAGEVLVVVEPAEGALLRRYTARDGQLVLEPLAAGRYTVTLPAQGGHSEQRRELELALGLSRQSFQLGPTAPGGH